jgi:hypothetical protein
MLVACQKIQEHVKEARDKNVITPPHPPPQLPAPQPQKFAKMHKNTKGVYLRAFTCLYTVSYGCLYMSTIHDSYQCHYYYYQLLSFIIIHVYRHHV